MHLIKKIKSWYGSMGSFNDLCISYQSGDAMAEAEERAINDHLKKPRTELYTQVEIFLEIDQALKRET